MSNIEAETPAESRQLAQPADDTSVPPAALEATADGPPPDRAPVSEDAPAVSGDEPAKAVDVWSRTQPKYRVRAYVLLGINLLLFCGLCTFINWLHGKPFDFGLPTYTLPAQFWNPHSPNLTDFILTPINVVNVPLHGVVIGLVMAVIVAVPIVVSVLYRFHWSLPFLLAVLVFAHMPWMTFTLLASCILATQRPFRMSFRFGSALVALLPVVAYLYLATRGSPQQLANYGTPMQKSLLVAPWLLALLAASIMMGAVLAIARLVDYRPGAVAPVLGIMFAIPVGLFHLGVGTDELAYRVLEAEFGPRSKLFEPVQKSRETQDAILKLIYAEIGNQSFQGQLRSDLLALWSLQPEKLRELKRTVSRQLLATFLTDRLAAYEACTRFIADYPTSRYVPNVLYIQGTVLDTRLDEARLAGDEPYRELYTGFPHVQSEEIWLKLVKQYPKSPFATKAGVRLAELQLRRGEVDQAIQNLRAVLGSEAANGPTTQPRQRSLLSAAPPEASLDFDPQPYRREGRMLLELILANRNDPRYGETPLIELAALDPRRGSYQTQLLHLINCYGDALLQDNLLVRWASSQSDIDERAAALHGCIETFQDGDGLPEAMFRLATLEMQTLAVRDEKWRVQGIALLREIVEKYPDTCWSALAAERLTAIEPMLATNGSRP